MSAPPLVYCVLHTYTYMRQIAQVGVFQGATTHELSQCRQQVINILCKPHVCNYACQGEPDATGPALRNKIFE